MYDQSQQQELIKQSQQLLQNIDAISADDITQLRQILNYHDWRYYVLNDAVVADYDYDRLFKALKKLEDEHPNLLTADSPTQRVARGLSENFPTVQHNIPMLSLDNSYNEEDLVDFDRKVRELTGEEEVLYSVEPKFDGGSIALVYENDMLSRAATRGNGAEGEQITNNAKVMKSIPLSAKFSELGIAKVELRGEVVIENGFFARLNEQREAEGLELFKNSRNTAAGALRVKDSSEIAKRGLEAFIYHIGYAVDADGNDVLAEKIPSHKGGIELLHQLGFKTPVNEMGSFSSIKEVVNFCHQWEEKRDTYNYQIDGMVIKVDRADMQRKTGYTAHHPRWAIAYKFKAKQATTKLDRIEYQVGRTGAITPVAKLVPVELAGVTVGSVSLHNEDFIKEKDIHIGDTVIVERAGDVIPYIAGVVADARDGSEQEVEFLRECPSCHTELVKPEGEAAWRCVNIDCPAQAEERMIHFVSKGAMDIEGLGKDIVKRFMTEGFVTHLPDLYRLPYHKILALEGWKEKSVENLRNGIEASKQQPLWRLIVGLGIRHVGSTMAKALAKQVTSIFEYANWTEEQLIDLEDVGPKVAESIVEFFHNPENIHILEQLKELGVNTELSDAETPSSQKLEGKTFLFTGSLTKFTRDEAKALVEDNGGKLLSGVSAKLNYLVAGEKAGSKLTKAQKLGTVEIIDEDAFLEMIG